MDYLSLFVKSIFVDNMIFAYFLGMCSYLAVSKNVKTAVGLGAAVTFVLIVTLPVNYMLENYVLAPNALIDGVDLSFLSFILFIAVIAGIVQLVEMAVERFSPSLYASLGIFLPLIAVNCAIMGASLFMQQRHFINIGEATTYALGSGIGWALGIKFNIAMLYLADEMFKNRHKTFTVTFGKPIPWQTFDKSKTPAQWAEYVKDIVYKL